MMMPHLWIASKMWSWTFLECLQWRVACTFPRVALQNHKREVQIAQIPLTVNPKVCCLADREPIGTNDTFVLIKDKNSVDQRYLPHWICPCAREWRYLWQTTGLASAVYTTITFHSGLSTVCNNEIPCYIHITRNMYDIILYVHRILIVESTDNTNSGWCATSRELCPER